MSETETQVGCESKVEQLAVADIIATKDNPRIIDKTSPGFLELAESIRAMGVLIPVHVRPHPKMEKAGKYELRAGERRLLASRAAGRASMLAIVHYGMTDEQAFELTFAENFAREDLTALEQSKAVATLLVKYRNDKQAVADKMGRSVRWVVQRANIHKNLTKAWQERIATDDTFVGWTGAHLGLIAAFPANVQAELLNHYEDSFYDLDGMISVSQLEKELAERLHLLSKTPWDLADSTLVDDAKACSQCQKRSSSQPGLFDDTTDREAVKKNDRCLDVDCWNRKCTAFMKNKLSELKSKYPTLMCIATNSPAYYARTELASIFTGRMSFNWKTSKEGAKGAVPALVVAGADAGEVRWIKPLAETGPAGSSRTKGPAGKPTPLAQRRKMLESKRWFVVIREVIEQVNKSTTDNIVAADKVLTVMAAATTFGTTFDCDHKGGWEDFEARRDETKASSIFKARHIAAELWASVKETIANNLTYCGPITQTSDELISDARAAAKLLGINVEAIYHEVTKTEYPTPKSWKGLKADGTPKSKTRKSGKKKTKKAKGKKGKNKKD